MEVMIKRTLLDPLKAHLQQKEISLIIGPRQSGKTTLMMILKKYLEDLGGKTLFLSLDIEADRAFFVSQDALVRKIRLELGEQKGFVFIDEIQRKEDAGLYLKGIYDMNLHYKFIVSGSGSVELKEKVHESLAGRKLTFQLGTLSFEEFVNFKTDYRYEAKLDEFFAVESIRAKALFDEYLMFGGYPRVVLAELLEDKRHLIGEIYHSYVEKDIFYLLKVEKEEAFLDLIKVIASQSGQLVNYSEIAATLGIALKTVKNYLWYLEKTFILEKSTPFYKNIRKEITRSPVYYFSDLGLRNFTLGVFGSPAAVKDGFAFQNFVFHRLKEVVWKKNAKISFWRTNNGAEVDFILNSAEKVVAVEVKNKVLKTANIQRSLRSFIKKYQPQKAYVINLSLKGEIEVGDTKVYFLPFFENVVF